MYRIRNVSMDTGRRTFLYTYIKTLIYLGPERVKSAWVKTWNLKKYQDPVSLQYQLTCGENNAQGD